MGDRQTDLRSSLVVGKPGLGQDEQALFIVERRRALLLLRALDHHLLQDHSSTHRTHINSLSRIHTHTHMQTHTRKQTHANHTLV